VQEMEVEACRNPQAVWISEHKKLTTTIYQQEITVREAVC